MDFRGAANHFTGPDFSREPVQLYEPGDDDPVIPPEGVPPTGDDEEPIPHQKPNAYLTVRF
jgi:type I restriction enzyme R subunit